MEPAILSRGTLNVLVIGQAGVGKTNLVDSILCPDIATYPRPRQEKLISPIMEVTQATLREGGTELMLNLIDTPGIKQRMDWAPLLAITGQQYEDVMYVEDLSTATENFVHCCLYLIKPTMNGLCPLEAENMKALCNRMNIIPIIAKADLLTDNECAEVKKRVLRDIAKYGIEIYGIAEDYNKPLSLRMPFAIASPSILTEEERKIKRGDVNVSNRVYNFFELKKMLLRSHVHDLKFATKFIHIENHITKRLFGFDVKLELFNPNSRRRPKRNKSPEEIAAMVSVNFYDNFRYGEHSNKLYQDRLSLIYQYMILENNHLPKFIVHNCYRFGQVFRSVHCP